MSQSLRVVHHKMPWDEPNSTEHTEGEGKSWCWRCNLVVTELRLPTGNGGNAPKLQEKLSQPDNSGWIVPYAGTGLGELGWGLIGIVGSAASGFSSAIFTPLPPPTPHPPSLRTTVATASHCQSSVKLHSRFYTTALKTGVRGKPLG